MHNARIASVSSKTEKSNAKDCSASVSAIPESPSALLDTTWPESLDPLPKSKGKSVKLKKNSKTENSKKLTRQGSKDSVVLVGYKNLKTPHSNIGAKYKEEEGSVNQDEEQDTLQLDSSSYSRTNASSVFDCSGTPTNLGNTADSVTGYRFAAACNKKVVLKNLSALDSSSSRAGTGANIASQQFHKDVHGDHVFQFSPGLMGDESKPSNKDTIQGDKVNILPNQMSTSHSSNIPKITQTDLCDSQQSAVESVFERPSKATAQCNQACVVSVQVKSDCIRFQDVGALCASSRLSDSGIESEPSSFKNQLILGPQLGQGFAELAFTASHTEKTVQSPALLSVQQNTLQKPSGTGEVPYPESTSGVSGVQSSLTSINSLPSDDEGERSSKSSSGAEVRGRKSSVLVQEQSVVFSGDVTQRTDVACNPYNVAVDFPIQADFRSAGSSEIGVEEVGGLVTSKESRSEPHTACPSSNSATSSTDLVKRGMVENYFGSCSSTDVSEISPVETSAITLGIQSEAHVEEDEDETEHEMIENGYYEEGDGYDFVNGVADDEDDPTQPGIAAPQEMPLLFDQLGTGHAHETKDSSKAPLCSNLVSTSLRYSLSKSPYSSTSLSSSLPWYECATMPQMKA